MWLCGERRSCGGDRRVRGVSHQAQPPPINLHITADRMVLITY